VTLVIGVDLGERRIGLAIAEEPGPRARPLATVLRGDALASDVASLRRAAGVRFQSPGNASRSSTHTRI